MKHVKDFQLNEGYKRSADFKKYYDSKLKQNIWVLGYFGGGPVKIVTAYELAQEYAQSTNVPLETVTIDEIMYSRRFKGFKFISSQVPQKKEPDAEESDNVFGWLHD
jgi:hypothetical protein